MLEAGCTALECCVTSGGCHADPVGFEMAYRCPQPTPMILGLNILYSRAGDLRRPDLLVTRPRSWPILSTEHDWDAAPALRAAARSAILASVAEPDAEITPHAAGTWAGVGRPLSRFESEI